MFETIMGTTIGHFTKSNFWKDAFGLLQAQADNLIFSNTTAFLSKTLLEAFEQAFVDPSKAQISIDFPQYFATCNPSECTYFKSTNRDPIEIVTVLSGLAGGLKIAVMGVINVIAAILCKKKIAQHVKGP